MRRFSRMLAPAALALCCVAALAAGGQRGKGSILAFQARTLDGWQFDFGKVNARRRLVVYLFDPTGRGADAATRAAERLHRERQEHNLAVVGVMMPQNRWSMAEGRAPLRKLSRAQLAGFAYGYLKKAGATFPCVADFEGKVTSLYRRAARSRDYNRRGGFFLFRVQAQAGEGNVLLIYDARQSTEPTDYIYRAVLRSYGIEPPGDVEPLAGDRPKAPDVTLVDTAGKSHRLSDYRGRLVVFVFIMRTCLQCKTQLVFLEEMLGKYGRAARGEKPWLEVLAVCVDASGPALRRFVAQRGYTFPVAGDADWAVRGAFRYRGGTPDTFVIAPDGTVRYRHKGYNPELEGVLHMEIRTLLGLKTEPILGRGRYTGGRACRVCHEKQHTDWSLTRHACAWETLVRLGKEEDPECVKCHVVAYLKPGGFITAKSTPHLADVQCESCHGRNGCRAFTGKPVGPVTAATCAKCHDAKHSPRFDFAKARPRVLHTRAEQLAKLPRAEREKELRKLCAGADRQLFDPNTPYVGSAVCGKCHPTAFKALADGFHATATRSLARPARSHWSVPKHKRGVVGLRRPECLRCHVTGFGQKGGFPAAVPEQPLDHSMAGVACEACHGPGKAHADDPKKPKAIARLGGTCKECNILPICRQCHDDANSPRFDYRTALPKVRHPIGKAKMP